MWEEREQKKIEIVLIQWIWSSIVVVENGREGTLRLDESFPVEIASAIQKINKNEIHVEFKLETERTWWFRK